MAGGLSVCGHLLPFLGDGGFCECVVVGDQLGIAAAIPDGLDTATAGVFGLAGSAAVDALDAAAPQAGETVLVSGAHRDHGHAGHRDAGPARRRRRRRPITVPVSRTYALGEVPDTFGDLAGGTLGKLAVTVA